MQLVQNMGGRYVAFRLMHELKKKTGIFEKQFPQNPPFQYFGSLEDWKRQNVNFFFNGRPMLAGKAEVSARLKEEFTALQEGNIPFFSSTFLPLGKEYDWLSNPDTGYQYNAKVHWSRVNDYSTAAGDIKYVWEKSRFSFLYTIIRYDACTDESHADWVFSEILSWIKANPVNSGPNYKCSQEISLRVLNWTFALHFYKNSDALTEEIFQEIMFSVYWQLHHVYHNIDFSRIAVRNNHAITETLALYLGGMLYPFFPEAHQWKTKGKKWFEEEIAYQIYPDGTFLQFSMNYHRVVVQLLTWAIRLADLNGERFQEVVYERAQKSLHFLTSCLNEENGWLPNYGANDGALFFKLNDQHYRDYRPQLEGLSRALGMDWQYGKFEDALWFGLELNTLEQPKLLCHSERREESFQKADFVSSNTWKDASCRQHDNNLQVQEIKEKAFLRQESLKIIPGVSQFPDGGYYLFRQEHSFTFIRCGNHKDRPSQADNLHLDIWYKGRNILHDAGSYKYNTGEKELRYFMGTQSHNTVMLESYNQMEKGARFIWYHWSQAEQVKTGENEEFYLFEGTIKAFQQVSKDIRHSRNLWVHKQKPLWVVEDRILNKPDGLEMKQLWHTHYSKELEIRAITASGKEIQSIEQEGFYSSFYGKKETCAEILFPTQESLIKTYISVKE